MKISVATLLLLFNANAFAGVDPREPRPVLSLNCIGDNADYPKAYVYQKHNYTDFEVVTTYDLDVPGGAKGRVTYEGTGEATEESVDIDLERNGVWIGQVSGGWNDNEYTLQIDVDNFSTTYTCEVVQ